MPGAVEGKRRHLWWLTGLLLVPAAAAAVIALLQRPPRVEGQAPQERVRSICRLASDRPRGAGAVIAAAAREEPDPATRAAALTCLSRFPGAQFRPAVEAGTRDADSAVRAAAAATMSQYKDESAAELLGGLLQGDRQDEVRLAAATALGLTGQEKAMVVLLETAEGADNRNVQVRSLQALLWMFKLRLAPARVRTQADILDAIETAKGFSEVQQAFKRHSRAMVRHPEHDRHGPDMPPTDTRPGPGR